MSQEGRCAVGEERRTSPFLSLDGQHSLLTLVLQMWQHSFAPPKAVTSRLDFSMSMSVHCFCFCAEGTARRSASTIAGAPLATSCQNWAELCRRGRLRLDLLLLACGQSQSPGDYSSCAPDTQAQLGLPGCTTRGTQRTTRRTQNGDRGRLWNNRRQGSTRLRMSARYHNSP